MVNRHRGEIAASLDGKQWTLCLTLGALAELESSFEVEDLSALTQRFGSGNLKSNDILRIMGAGLRGAGHTLSDDEIAQMQAEGGAAGYVRIVTELLTVTFGATE